MRAVLHSDLVAAARALLAVPPQVRTALCRQLLEKADWADRYVRRLGRIHPNRLLKKDGLDAVSRT